MVWDAAVLAGGASRRMGRDKALLPVDGVPMVRRVVDAARSAGAARVIVVGGDQPALAAAVGDLAAIVADLHPGEGPLGGLLTAFDHLADADHRADDGGRAGPSASDQVDDAWRAGPSASEACLGRVGGGPDAVGIVLAVACDLLAPAAGAMRATVDAMRAAGADGDVAVPEVGGQEQWLHAAWRSGTVAAGLAERFAAGERSVRRAVAQCGLRVAHVGGIGPTALVDADTPADLERHGGQHPEWH